MFDILFQKYITAKNIFFLIITILLLIIIFKNVDIAILFFASFVISCSLNPLADILVEKTKVSRTTAAIIVLIGGILLCLLVIVPVVFLAVSEISAFAENFPQYIDELDIFITNSQIIQHSGINNFDSGTIVSGLSASVADILKNIVDIGKNIGSCFIYFVISFMLMFYFIADKAIIRKTFLRMFPAEMRKNAGSIIDIISQKIGGYITALVVTMMSVGVVMIIGLILLKVPYALLLSLITAVFDIIPVIGPTIAFVICIITTYPAGASAVVSVIAVFAIAQIAENQFVRPYIFGKMLNLHPILIYLFLFIAAKYMGITGVIFAPAVAATVCVLIEELYMKKLD